MSDYSLNANESLLYKGAAYGFSEVILTNINLVLVQKRNVRESKRLFSKTTVQTDIITHPISEIKIYNDTPQVKTKEATVEIYFISGEEKIDFYSKIEALKFTNAVYELLTGKSFAVRGAEKVKSAINLVDETLGINTVNTVKNVMENGITGSILGGIGKQVSKISKTSNTKHPLGIVKKVIDATSTDSHEIAEQVSPTDNLDKIKKLKELLDIGAITQEEFDEKKKELLNL